MTSSNNNLRKVRTRTWISLALATSIFVSLGYLFMEVSRQSAEFGEIKANYGKYVNDLQNAEAEFEAKEKELANLNAALSGTRTELSNITAELSGLTIQRDQERQRLDQLRQEINDKIEENQNEQDKLRKLISDQEIYDQINVQLADAGAKLSKTNAEISGLQSNLSSLRDDYDAEKANFEELQRQLGNLETKKALAKANLDALNANYAIQIQKKTEIENAVSQSESTLKTNQNDLAKVIEQLNLNKPKLESERQALGELQAQIDAARKDLAVKRNDITNQESRRLELDALITQEEARLAQVTDEFKDVQSSLNQEKPILERERQASKELLIQSEAVQRDLVSKKAEISAKESRLVELSALVAQAETRLTQANTSLDAVRSALNEERPNLENERNSLAQVRIEFASLQKELAEKRDEASKVDSRRLENEKLAAQAENRLALANTQLNEVQASLNQDIPRLDAERQALTEAQANVQVVQTDLAAKLSEVSKQEARRIELNTLISEAEMRLAQRQGELQQASVTLAEAKTKLESERKALSEVQSQLIEVTSLSAGNFRLFEELAAEIKVKELRLKELDAALED